MKDEKIKKLIEVLGKLDKYVISPDQLAQVIQAVLKLVKDTKDSNDTNLKNVLEIVKRAVEGIKQANADNLTNLQNKINTIVKGKDGVDGKDGRDGIDGVSPNENRIIEKVQAELKIPSIDEIQNEIIKDLPNLGTQIRDSLQKLTGEKRLDRSAIKGLDSALKRVAEIKSRSVIGGSRSNNSTKFYPLTPDGSNKTFSVPKSVASIVLSSDFPTVLMENKGFTINATRTQIVLTTDNAPSLGSQLLYQYSSMFN